MEHCPWIEKYRPTKFEDIVLDGTNKKILNNIVSKQYFPNLLFYGPPGTGKTTTIINLVKRYQEKYSAHKKKECLIHLNASDDRGIDIIRNQIYQFVNTKTLFGTGMKFVVLDEVDYMTKNAQQALRYLIQQYSNNVRFCLICNYISRIEQSLQNEFMRLRFCRLPATAIFQFLNRIQGAENLGLNPRVLRAIQKMFKSDIRSMINFMQSNHGHRKRAISSTIPSNKAWQKIVEEIKTCPRAAGIIRTHQNMRVYKMDYGTYIKGLIGYLLDHEPRSLDDKWISLFRFVLHNESVREKYLHNYFVAELASLYKAL